MLHMSDTFESFYRTEYLSYLFIYFLKVTVHFARYRNPLFPRSIILLNSFSFFPHCFYFISFAHFVLLKNFSSIFFLSFSLSWFGPYLICCTFLIYINSSSRSLQICSLTDFSPCVLLFSVTIIFLILVVFVWSYNALLFSLSCLSLCLAFHDSTG